MAKHNFLYQQAVYYDIVFDRDVSCEVNFIHDLYCHFTGREPQSVLDIACGPGYHAREFARRGLRAVGLDLREEMIAFARDKDALEGLALEWIAQDMRDFQLARPVDIAFTMFDGLDALTQNADQVHHFRAVANNLTSHGVYLVDLTHPRDLSFTHYRDFRYRGERGGVEVEIVWGTNQPRYDLGTGVARVELEMHINDHGQHQVIRDSADERLLYPQELSLIADLSGRMRMVGLYGSYDLNQPLDFSPASERMLVAFQRVD